MNNLVKIEPRNVTKAICSIHGDIGIHNPETMVDMANPAQTINFTYGGQTVSFCLLCIRDLLLKDIDTVKLVEEEIL